MKTKLFNIRLFHEFFQQLKILGIIVPILLCGGSMFYDFVIYSYKFGNNYIANITNVAPLLYYAIYLIPIVFTFKAFSFLNKRNECDFYHSIPDSLASIFISAALASFCWSFISIIVTTVIGYLSLIILGAVCPFSYVLYLIAYNTVIALLIIGCSSIAASLTSSFVRGIIITVIIMFLPRIIIFISNKIVYNVSMMANMPNDSFIFNADYNFLSAMLIDMLNGKNINVLLPAFTGGYIYSIILSLIYLLLGCFLFCRRKSEIANSSVYSPIKKKIFCLTVSFPALFIATYILIEYIGNYPAYFDPMFYVLLFVSIAFYFIYYAATTRSIKAALKTAPAYFINVGICALIGLCSIGIGYIVQNDTPSPSQVSYLEISAYPIDYKDPLYIDAVRINPRYDNKEMISIACEQLKETSENIKKETEYMYRPAYFKNITLTLKSGRRITRRIFFWQDAERFETLLQEEKAKQADNIYKLPKDSEIAIMYGRNWFSNFDDQMTEELWESYKREYISLPASVKSSLATEDSLANEKYTPFKLYLSGNAGLLAYSNIFYITPEMPETFELASSMAFNKDIYNAFKEAVRQTLYTIDTGTPGHTFYMDIKLFNNPDIIIEGIPLRKIMDKYNNGITISYGELDILRLINECTFEKATPDKAAIYIELYTGYYTSTSNGEEKSEIYCLTIREDDKFYPQLLQKLANEYIEDQSHG